MSLADSADPRPAVWVGHISLGVPDVQASKAFFVSLGMRDLEVDASVAVLELRAGTHLVLLPAETRPTPGTRAPFDLMVEDIERAHRYCARAGLAPTELERGTIHTSFSVREPGGHDVTINSSHNSGQPV